ncbi:MAG: DNA-3-methyladenine glycosylase 2 family protein [Hyphomicrobiaceae bacterium]|nr:DNA-3-methyladenine glycosylase 2 family protein [Hyphomicrobiaceae bacterium]
MARRPSRSKPRQKRKPKAAAPAAVRARPRRAGKAAAVAHPAKPGRQRKPAPAVLAPAAVERAVDRIIAAEADIAEGVAELRRLCPTMCKVHDLAGHPPLRRREAGFEGLARIIVGQQLSVASAAAIWTRTFAAVQPFTAERLLALAEADLARAGLSRPKIRTLRAVSQACVGGLDLVALTAASDTEVHARLTEVSGIGPWTADIYLMFCLGRADAWAPGDLALQIAAQHAFGLKARPTREELAGLAERWRPWRGVAARLLWSYYAVTKQMRQAIPV